MTKKQSGADASGQADDQTINESEQLRTVRNQLRDTRRELNVQIAELTEQNRDYQSMVEMLNVGEGDDPITMLRAVLGENESLRRENQQLLTAEISQQVASRVSDENMRFIIEDLVAQRKPARKADVQTHVDAVLAQESVKRMMRSSVEEQSGPPQTRPNTPPPADDQGGSTAETAIHIPGMVL